METLLTSMHWVMRVYPTHRLLQIKRLARSFTTVLEAVVEADRVARAIPTECAPYGLVVDMRNAVDEGDPDIEVTMGLFYEVLQAHVARTAILVAGDAASHAAHRVIRGGGDGTIITASETAAFEFAKGLAVALPRSRRMSPQPRRISTPDPVDEALHWADDLDEWAKVREKVMTKLDIRSAKRARGLASELRRAVEVAVDLSERREGEIERMAPLLEELAALRIEAVELMLGAALPPARSEPTTVRPGQSGTRPPATSLSAIVRALDRAGDEKA